MEIDVEKVKASMLGDWVSIAPEVRPSATKNTDGTLKPFYLKRAFKYLAGDRFDHPVDHRPRDRHAPQQLPMMR